MGACFSSQAAPPEGQGAGKDRAPDAGLELGAAPDVRDNNCSSLTSVSNGFASERGSPEEACAQASCSLHPQLSLGQMMKDNRSNSNSSVWDLLSSSQSALDPMHLAGLLPSRRVVEVGGAMRHVELRASIESGHSGGVRGHRAFLPEGTEDGTRMSSSLEC